MPNNVGKAQCSADWLSIYKGAYKIKVATNLWLLYLWDKSWMDELGYFKSINKLKFSKRLSVS